MQYEFTENRYGHKRGDIVEMTGWDEYYYTKKKVIVPYHREAEIKLETPELPAVSTIDKTTPFRPKKKRK